MYSQQIKYIFDLSFNYLKSTILSFLWLFPILIL